MLFVTLSAVLHYYRMKQRYQILIEYDGTGFCGWQRQETKIASVQQIIEESIFKFTGENVLVYGSGRTDAGVHAVAQVAHFDLTIPRTELEIIGAINHYARSHKLVILDCKKAHSNFHARFSAIERSYLYKIINRKSPLVIMQNRAWHITKTLDLNKMKEGAKFFEGNNDFTSFRASQCQGKSPVKTINKIELTQVEEEINLFISAPSFLHHMVRNIVGTLVYVGHHKILPGDIVKIFEAKNRIVAGPTAPACGLYFLEAKYNMQIMPSPELN